MATMNERFMSNINNLRIEFEDAMRGTVKDLKSMEIAMH